ncbi:MAG TPA: YihY/virulence factor BrkB family protein [Solirubrobacteraceae bacterium]|nr:YihY/virulence factor BrkB family protein [Solirubrobacteraceae bacterium]
MDEPAAADGGSGPGQARQSPAHRRASRVVGERIRRGAGRVAAFYWDSGISDDVPALAWYLIGACVPLTLGVAALAAVVLGDGAQAERAASRVADLLPPSARDQVLELVLRTRRDSPWLLALAVGSMVWAGAGATGVVERVASRLLAAPRPGPVALKLRHLGLAAIMVLLIGLMAITATEATGLRARLNLDVPPWVPLLVSAVVIAGITALLYRYAATRHLTWRAAMRGGVPAAVALEATPLLAGYYARAVAGRTPVQVFLVLAGLLFTCYLVAVGLLVGAGLAVARQHALDRATSPSRRLPRVSEPGGAAGA